MGNPKQLHRFCGDTVNEDGQPQVAPQVCRQRGNEGMQPQAPQQQRMDAPPWICNDAPPGGNYSPLDTPLTGNTGLTHPVNENPEPSDFFKLYFTGEIYELICRETNTYAHQYIQAHAANFGPKINSPQMEGHNYW